MMGIVASVGSGGCGLGLRWARLRVPAAGGENRIYGHCVLRRVTAAGDTLAERLFGLVVERGGAFKLVSYANKLD